MTKPKTKTRLKPISDQVLKSLGREVADKSSELYANLHSQRAFEKGVQALVDELLKRYGVCRVVE